MNNTKHNKILQWNSRGLKPNYNEILLLKSLFSPQVFCIEETKLNKTDSIYFSKYTSYHYIHNDCQKASGGSSVLIKADILHSTIDLTTNLQTKAVKVTLSKTITICSVYIPPNSNLEQNKLENLLLQLPHPYIIMGEFNGHSQLWGCSDFNNKGKIIRVYHRK